MKSSLRGQNRTRDRYAPSPRARRTAALLGVWLDRRGGMRSAIGPGWRGSTSRRERVRQACARASDLLDELPPGGMALITGPSGSGKSTLLAAAGTLGRRRGGRVVVARLAHPGAGVRSSRRVIDLAGGAAPEDAHAWLRLLSQCGMGEAGPLLRRADQLSTGQSQRVALALALWKARPLAGPSRAPRGGVLLVIDALGESLDRLSAASVCVGLRRALVALGPRVRTAVATAHDDLHPSLRPDVHVHLALN